MENYKIHPGFKLNGISLSEAALLELAYCMIKEGESFEIAIGDFIIDWLSKSDRITVTTSGSTGLQKPIVLKKEHMFNSALATGEFLNLRPEKTALLCLPADYIAGKMMLVRAMVLGLELDYLAPSSTPLRDNKKTYDFTAMVPLQLQNSLPNLFQIKKLIVGGAPVLGTLLQQIKESTTSIYETYGMTETITHIALKNISAGEPFFKTLPNISLSRDQRDCLVINAPMISDAEITTNDVVRLISAYEFEWLGRYDSIINSGGIKLNPESIEKKLATLIPGRFFVTGIPDSILGQKLVLVLEGSYQSNLLDNIQNLKSLQKFEIPKEIYTTAEFSLTPNGKIQRMETLKKFEFHL